MKSIFLNVIDRGGYDLSGLLKRIDSFHIEGKLTDAERDELYARARGGARTEDGVNLWKKMMEMDERLRKLETGTEGSTGEETPSEYIPGKWYYGGDRVTYSGKTYTCTAPEGSVCTWSPDEYPAYWQEE